MWYYPSSVQQHLLTFIPLWLQTKWFTVSARSKLNIKEFDSSLFLRLTGPRKRRTLLSVHHGRHQELPVRLVWEKEADSKLRHPSSGQQKQAEVYVWGERSFWHQGVSFGEVFVNLTPHSLQVRVDSFNYIGMGNSTNKKDAQTNAARDFVNYLVRIGEMNAAEVPALGVRKPFLFFPSVFFCRDKNWLFLSLCLFLNE